MKKAGMRAAHSDEIHAELGAQLEEIRRQRGLSDVKLAKISGVSRRHIAEAKKGKNITVGVLKKLARALQITEINLGNLTARADVEGIDPTVIVTVIEQMEQGMAMMSQAVSTLHAYITAKPAAASDLNSEAAALVRGITMHAKKLERVDPRRLASLEQTMRELLDRAPETASNPSRRRKRSA